MKPLIAIVGRPNVGKSTLLNALAGKRVALTADVPGVTRDPIFADLRTPRGSVLLVDTAGFDPRPEDELGHKVIEQTRQAVADAQLVLLLVDAAAGLHPLDREMALLLKKAAKPALCLVNKVDPGSRSRVWEEFFQLGLECLPVSALHRHGLGKLLERLGGLVSWDNGQEDEKPQPDFSLCLLGRPNSGKSSLANRLLGRERQVVSRAPGTTRDAVDLELERDGTRCVLVDTPGIRRRSRIDQSLERMSVAAALHKLERSDIAALVLDAAEEVSDQDARLADLVKERGKGLVIVLNKIDLLGDAASRRQALARARRALRFVSYAPCCMTSALTAEGVERLLPLARRVKQALALRLSTGQLNRLLTEFVERHPPPQSRGRRPRIYYISQVRTAPPLLVAKVSNPKHFSADYLRYLENQLRQNFDFCGAPIFWKLRSSERPEREK